MDRYMNDTHSLYYNVDHSSMFGSNLSTVFADGPPPLEDSINDDDHGEFVFSSETDAIGQAVLSKIESKLQRDAEGRPVSEHEKSSLNSVVETKPNSSAEKFEAFGNFETSNQFDTSGKQEVSVGSSQEVNGFKEIMRNNAQSEDDFSDDEFGDFSTGFVQNSNFNENDKPDIEKHDGNFCDFSSFKNESKLNDKSMFAYNEQASSNGEGGNDSNDFELADFESFDGADLKTSDWGMKSNDNTVVEQDFGNNSVTDNMGSQIENNDASDDEFASFEEADYGDFGKFETNKIQKTSGGNLISPKPDVIPSNKRDDLTTPKLPHDLTTNETKNNDVVKSFEAFKDHISSNERNELMSDELPPDLTNHETKNNDEFNSFGAFNDDSFNDFTSTNDDGFEDFSQSFPTAENETKNKSQAKNNECQASATDVSKPDTNLESKTEGNVDASCPDDFVDFADFSNNSYSAFSSDNSRTNKSKETNKDLSRSNSNCSTQNSNEFTAFSESTNSKKEQKFEADFGAFSESTISKNKPDFQVDFGAFSENAGSKNKQRFQENFGAFSQDTVPEKSFNQTLSTKQNTRQTRLVSLHACFQDVFVTLQYKVEDLQHVKGPGEKRINQENLWKNLHSNMGEGALRFSWGQCKTSDKMCKALEVSRKNIVVNPNILAMSEGVEIPVFATGLGILQPSIVPTPPKKKKTKNKKQKDVVSETSSALSTPPPSLPPQTAFSEFKTEGIKDSNSDTASLSNSDTASLDLDFFASAPSNLPVNSDPSSSSSPYNLDFAFGPAPPGNQASLVNSQREFDSFKPSKPVQDDPLEILKKLDTSKMSSSVVNESHAQLSSPAMEIIETFDDLSFMHSSVLMFPLHKNN